MYCANSARLLAAVLLCSCAPAILSATAAPESVTYGRFGDIAIYRGLLQPHDFVLFLSGDGGWNLGVIAMAQRLASRGAVVAGVDIRHYLGELEKSAQTCVAPASDLEDLSRQLQSKLGFKTYLQP